MQEQVSVKEGMLSGMQKDESLIAHNQTLNKQVAARTQLMSMLDTVVTANSYPFSNLMTGLARQRVDQLWLTRIQFANGGETVGLEGKALQADAVPHYIQMLRGEALLLGRSFDLFQLSTDEDKEEILIAENNPELDNLATIFGAPFVFYSKHVKKSFRNTCYNLGKTMLLFEGGKSFHIDNHVSNTAVNGAKRILHHFGMLQSKFKVSTPKKESIFITQGKWQRANFSGMFKATAQINEHINKGDVIGNITDPYGEFNHFIKANHSGYVINVNQAPIVYQGDALFHVSTSLKK